MNETTIKCSGCKHLEIVSGGGWCHAIYSCSGENYAEREESKIEQKNMSDKIQMTEEQAREILHECICTETCDLRLDAIIKVMKHKGYILLDPVEEAEEMYQEWLNREEDMSETLVMNKMCKAIQYLKAKLEVRHE